MEATKISAETFKKRFERLLSLWDQKYPCDVVSILYGKEDPKAISLKTSALHLYFLGYEFVDSQIFLSKKNIVILASQKKIALLSHLKEFLAPEYNLHFLQKQQDNIQLIEQALQIIRDETSKAELMLGVLQKEKQFGQLAQDFAQVTQKMSTHDVTTLVQELLIKKDEAELDKIKKAAGFSCYLQNKIIEQVEKIIDQASKEKQDKISQTIEQNWQTAEAKSYLEKKLNCDANMLDLSFSPVIQSGGVYDVRPQAVCNSNVLAYDTILCSVGSKYHEYNAHCVRTLFINPTDEQKKNYQAAYELQGYIIGHMKAGVLLSDIWQKGMNWLKEKYAHLVDCVGSHFGHGMGLEFRESLLMINEKNHSVVQEGMVFMIGINFTGLQFYNLRESKGKNYAIQLNDTVIFQNGACYPLTFQVARKFNDVSYQFDEDSESEEESEYKEEPEVLPAKRQSRGKTVAVHDSDGNRKQNQKELLQRKQQELEERLASGQFKQGQKKQVQVQMDNIRAYKSQQEVYFSFQVPKDYTKNQIYVDMKKFAVILPINGHPIVFHISVIKNVSKHDEGNTSSIRFNFHVPSSGVNQGSMVFPTFNNAPIYIRELTFRSHDVRKLNENLKKIKELQKNIKLKEQEDKNRDDLAVTEPIQMIKGKRPCLQDLKMRPNLTGRKTSGTLEAHMNGFRYQTTKSETIQINYSNIKHAFFQNCDGELIVLLHFHLHQPIMLGKKKTLDIQFYTEAGIQTEDLDFKKRTYTDHEEIEQEEREKAMRKRLNKEFEMFSKAVEAVAQNKITFESPYRDLGFYGTPHRSQVFVVPTINCLVNLIEVPFFIQPIEEIEIAHFERIQFGLKNFDLALVNKDYDKPVERVSAIPISYLEPMRNWLKYYSYFSKMDILYSETNKNLAWDAVMNQIKEDYEGFVEDGGWGFLQEEEEASKEVDDQDEDSESEFIAEEDVSEDDSDEDESQDIDDEEDEEFSESDFDEDNELSEEGLSWDELEEVTKKQESRREVEKSRTKRR